ncbi:MAG: NADH/ubiquinone/plastoquinone (complex I) [Elusimicrobia bacterium]|nr:NADH/ubiquinone/plastoquinone (complex I) [Elusimicrobiota bacterium]
MLILLFPLLPIISALCLIILERFDEDSGDYLSSATAFVLFAMAVTIIFTLNGGVVVYHLGGWGSPLGVDLVLDGFSALFLVVINLVGFVSMLYSIEYMKKFTAKAKFYILHLFLIAGLNGIVLSGDIFNFYVFMEIVAFASYALIAFGVEQLDLEASIRYQVLGTVGSFFVLLGIGILYSVTGTLDLADMSRFISQTGINRAILFAVPLLLFGFALKAALVPFHAWLPDAHPTAPTPVSAMLSGVVIKVCSIYGIVRIFFGVTGVSPTLLQILLYAGLISIFFGAFSALRQTDFKRLLAYSSISQIGYIMLGIGTGTPLGYAGAMFHILNHATFKSLFFIVAGAVEHSTGERNITKLGGLSDKMPVTFLSSLSASFSLGGVPPFGGFFSKLLIILGLFKAGYLTVGLLVVLSAVFTLAYFLKIQRNVFLRLPTSHFPLPTIKEVPVLMRVSMLILAIICLGLGLAFPWILKAIVEPAVAVLTNGCKYGSLILGL